MAHSSGRIRPLTARTLVSLAVASALGAATPAGFAQTAPAGASSGTEQLEEVTVTGSLIPQPRETTVPTPVITITQEQLENNGFVSISDALQQGVYSTGGTQKGIANSFTPGAETISMFGLDPGYTKFLIDGKAMGNYPSLFNGTDLVTSISGIPSQLIDHIDVLPGGQSSIYGSDAIAGVVNVVMKKHIDGLTFDAKYGWDKEGGGSDRRFAISDGLTLGNLNVVGGVQYELNAPIWGYQRQLTSSYNYGGSAPGIAARDWLLFGYYGQADGSTYYFQDPTNCAGVASQFGGSVSKDFRPDGHGYYCGSYNAGYDTYENGESQVQGYVGATFDVGDHLQLYANVLLNHDVNSFSAGTGEFGTDVDSNSPYYYYYDPNLGDFMNFQHLFSPEEAGGLSNIMSEDITNSERFTLGGRGSIGASPWSYDASMTYEQDKLTERIHMQFTTPIEDFYSSIMGPETLDPVNGPSYTPNYPAFYQPITPAEYDSFSGDAVSYSYTEFSLARGQLTDTDLFTLPGGKAALALAAEGGDEGWNYVPDPRYLDGETYGYTSVGGSGHRSRYAGTLELRLPVTSMLNVTASGRYDKYNVSGGDFQKFTYNMGLEFTPIQQVTVRGRYGTAFKAPTLADEFQGESGYFTSVTDYYQCAKAGYTIAAGNLQSCNPIYLNANVEGATQGSTTLKPITATVWDAGLVFKPLKGLMISSDLMEWNINNEVEEQPLDQLMQLDSECLLGQLDASSPTCQAAINQVQRDPNTGVVTTVSTPKVNAANERLTTLFSQLNYQLMAGAAGRFTFDASWTDMLRHYYTQFAGDTPIDLLGNPFWSTEFKSKINASLTWDFQKFSTTVFVNRDGRTPNYLARQSTLGYSAPGAGILSAYTVTNWSARYQVLPELQVQVSIDNVFNDMPPIDRTYPNYQEGPYNTLDYNIVGRQYWVGATYKFLK